MSEKQRLLNQIVKFLTEKKADKNNPVIHDIYLLVERNTNDDCVGKMESVWLDENNVPMCKVNPWGMVYETELSEITARNLETLRDFLRDGHVIQ